MAAGQKGRADGEGIVAARGETSSCEKGIEAAQFYPS